MRDLERWKDKVELSLDGRQIFFLFFGSAVAACLIFVVGVLVGKRLEARALALQPPAVEDPLAALDQLGEADDSDDGLTFHKALTSGKKESARPAPPHAPPAEPGKVIEAKAEVAPPPVEKVAEKIAALPHTASAEPSRGSGEKPVEPKPIADKPVEKAKTEAKVEAKPKAPLPSGKPQVVANGKKPEATSPHFTLQLSAFPDKGDAEEFMRKIQSAGYRPFLVASEIPGKGIFYRVRVGDYSTRQAAVDAKSEFERKQRMIAYVAKL